MAPAAAPEPPPAREPEPEPEPPDPERVRAYRVDDLTDVPPAKERLSRIFAEDHDVEGPAYGREEPGLSDYHGPPRPHLGVFWARGAHRPAETLRGRARDAGHRIGGDGAVIRIRTRTSR